MKILKEFVEESKLHILQESYRQQDWSKYRISMHTIKSSVAGAEELISKPFDAMGLQEAIARYIG